MPILSKAKQRERVKSRKQLARLGHCFNTFLSCYFENLLVQLVVLLVAILSCVFYLLEVNGFEQILALEVFFFTVFLVDYILCIAASNRKVDYIFSFIGLADLASLLPILGTWIADYSAVRWPPSWLGFFRFFRLLQVFQLFRLRDALAPEAIQPQDAALTLSVSEIHYQIARLIITIFVFIFIGTGVIYAVAGIHHHAYPDSNPHSCFNSIPSLILLQPLCYPIIFYLVQPKPLPYSTLFC